MEYAPAPIIVSKGGETVTFNNGAVERGRQSYNVQMCGSTVCFDGADRGFYSLEGIKVDKDGNALAGEKAGKSEYFGVKFKAYSPETIKVESKDGKIV